MPPLTPKAPPTPPEGGADYTTESAKGNIHCCTFALSVYQPHPLQRVGVPPFGGGRGGLGYSYSCQLLMRMSSCRRVQNASMKAEASRAFVMSGMLWSMAPRRMR